MNRAFANILCDEVAPTAQFYEDILGFRRTGDFGWFILLCHDGLPGFELGVLNRNHETIPHGVATNPAGVIMTFVVEDLDVIYQEAVTRKAEIVQDPTDLPYGQRRLMLRDPAGTLVDVSSPIK